MGGRRFECDLVRKKWAKQSLGILKAHRVSEDLRERLELGLWGTDVRRAHKLGSKGPTNLF